MADNNTLNHVFVSAVPDDADASLVKPSDWNKEHIFTGGISGQFLAFDDTKTDNVSWKNNISIVSTFGSLPSPSLRGRLALVSDNYAGVFYDDGSSWVPLNNREISVLDYGAKVDGVTDDTDAVLAAVAAAKALEVVYDFPGRLFSQPAIVFPAGMCLISDTIEFSQAGNIISRSGGIIQQTDPTKDVFNFNDGYFGFIQGIQIQGGKTHIRFTNNNINGAMLFVDKCFLRENNLDYMIKIVPGALGVMSSFIVVQDTRILYPYKVCQTYAETTFRNTWVETSYNGSTPGIAPNMADGEMFDSRVNLTFDRMYGVPLAGSGGTAPARLLNAHWVDNYGIFLAHNSRFGAEDAGMPIVWQYASALFTDVYPYELYTGVTFENCQLAIGPTSLPLRALIRLMTAVPQRMIVKNNFGLTRDSSDIIITASGFDIDTYIASLNSNVKFYFDFLDNVGHSRTFDFLGIPAPIATRARTPIYRDNTTGYLSIENTGASAYPFLTSLVNFCTYTASFQLGDDIVKSFTTTEVPVFGLLMVLGNTAGRFGLFSYRRTGGTEAIEAIALGSAMISAGTNNLTDGTGDGTDGFVNVSVNGAGSGLLKIKNRTGSAQSFRVFIIS